jgi:hypothetical protein
MCVNSNYNGYKDWYLPSSLECSLICEGIPHRFTISGLVNSKPIFWSSTYETYKGARLSDGSIVNPLGTQSNVVAIRKVNFPINSSDNSNKDKIHTHTSQRDKTSNSNGNSDLESRINAIVRATSNLNLMGSKLYLKGQIDSKKWKNFAAQFDSNQIGTIDDCYLYFDNTVFGSGDDGFMMTKNLFCWKNKFSKPLATFNTKLVKGYQVGADTSRFYAWKKSFNVFNGASAHNPDSSAPGFVIDSNNSLIDISRTVKVLNQLLEAIKQGQ